MHQPSGSDQPRSLAADLFPNLQHRDCRRLSVQMLALARLCPSTPIQEIMGYAIRGEMTNGHSLREAMDVTLHRTIVPEAA